MTTIEITLPDDLVASAHNAGLLSDSSIQRLLEDAIRRQAGQEFLRAARDIHSLGIPSMSDEEIVAEVKAVRSEQRAKRTASNM